MATDEPKPEEAPAPPAGASPEGEAPTPPVWELLFEEHKKTLLFAVIALVIAVLVGVIINHRGDAQKAAAGMAFSSASTIAEFEAVSRDHSGTAAGGSALLMKADVAMYKAKEQAGSSFAFFDEQLNLAAAQRVVIESELRRALGNEALGVHFQPKVQLKDLEASEQRELPRDDIVSELVALLAAGGGGEPAA